MRRNLRIAMLAAVVLASSGGLSSACSSSDGASACTGDSGCVDDAGIGVGDDGVRYDVSIAGYPPGTTVLGDGAIKLPERAIVAPGTPLGPCVSGGTQCTNCIDDDGDGKVDWLDPECTGPLDNDESSYATGIPGDNVDPCKQDCWFD